jgi:hypothetical protein
MEPSYEGEQARPKDRRREKLESLRRHFEQTTRPTAPQSGLLNKNVEIVKRRPSGHEAGLSKSAILLLQAHFRYCHFYRYEVIS